MEQTLRQRAEALLELARNADEDVLHYLIDTNIFMQLDVTNAWNNKRFIVESRTDAPYLAQKLIDALDVIHGYESECMCRVNGNGRCERCQKAGQFLQERNE